VASLPGWLGEVVVVAVEELLGSIAGADVAPTRCLTLYVPMVCPLGPSCVIALHPPMRGLLGAAAVVAGDRDGGDPG
jgi:hypothetical protein